jgi:hypothetical protein
MSLLTNFINSPYSFETIMTYIITPFSKFNDKIHLPVRHPYQPHRASEILWLCEG